MRGRYLFDASSIIASAVERRFNPLLENYTLQLAGYEIGNYLWREAYLRESINVEELKMLVELFNGILRGMKMIEGQHPSHEIVNLAGRLGLTYYDAAYLYNARRLNLTLVTEDRRLSEIGGKFVKAIKIDELP